MKSNLHIQLAWASILSAGLRSLLTVITMALGITAVVVLIGLSKGAQRQFEATLKQSGNNLLSISSERIEANALRGNDRRYETLTIEDSMAILNEVESVHQVAPFILSNVLLAYQGEVEAFTLFGTVPAFQQTNNQWLLAGRFIDQNDIDTNRKVAVIGSEVVKLIFFDEQVLGARILINGVPFEVVGILKSKGSDLNGANQDDRIIVPISTAMRRLLNTDKISRIAVQYQDKSDLDTSVEAITQLLRFRHGLTLDDQANDFTIRNQSVLTRTILDTNVWLNRILLGVSILSLTLSALGLFSVSQLAVKERQEEIGLRLAVGAKPQQIWLQFLAEAIMVAMLGTMVGIIFGLVCLYMGEYVLNWHMSVSGTGILFPVIAATMISVISGAVPAYNAANLDPIVALRSC
ncbi:MAG: ABC transporter permease [Marinicella sp.]